MVSDMDVYFDSINVLEDAVIDDNKFPVVKDNNVKKCCYFTLEFSKMIISYMRLYIRDATKKDI